VKDRAVVPEQHALSRRGDEDVVVAVPVVVGRRAAHSVERHARARGRRHVVERAVALPAIERARGARSSCGLVARPVRGADEEDVEVAVAVEVEERGAGAHRPGGACRRRPPDVDETDVEPAVML
jgi:hypothetical protein